MLYPYHPHPLMLTAVLLQSFLIFLLSCCFDTRIYQSRLTDLLIDKFSASIFGIVYLIFHPLGLLFNYHHLLLLVISSNEITLLYHSIYQKIKTTNL